MFAKLARYLKDRTAEFDRIESDRKSQLRLVSDYIRGKRTNGMPVRLVFICTHNSRRSHMAHVWATVAAASRDLQVSTFSGGTEATSFNPRAVAALERAGFQVERTSDDENSIYHLRFARNLPAITCFSKRFENAPNPRDRYAAIMVCGQADHSCPSVAGAYVQRFSLPYGDPKSADGRYDEATVYDQRCAEIAREMLYIMHGVATTPERAVMRTQ